jgi:hypothetical protein
MRSTRRTRSSLLAALSIAGLTAAVATASPAVATKPGPGTSTGTGTVFMVNPVQSSGNQDLTDQKDSAAAVPSSAYTTVTLHNLDGSGYLRGTWANVLAETGTPAYSPTGVFSYRRDDDRFEQVMAYYFVDAAQRYLQGLGFGSQLPAVNAESQDVRTNQLGVDNSFSWDKHDLLRFGKGGVDDAEDGEVIVHEYGHAVHDAQVPGFGSSLEAGSIGEAFGDYLAVTVGLHEAEVNGWPVAADRTCVADWDSVSYTRAPHCLRTLSENKHYPEDVQGEVHADGEIWSQALWTIRESLGTTVADRIIVNAQFGFAPDTSFAAAAKTTTTTAATMYGARQATAVRAAFAARGIVFD